MSQYAEFNKQKITRVKFSPKEDQKIIELFKKFGGDWNKIQSYFGTSRSKRQLKERWKNYLDPNLSKDFTQEEDHYLMVLLKYFSNHKCKWSLIADKMGNKSSVQCRNRARSIESSKNVHLKRFQVKSNCNVINKSDKMPKIGKEKDHKTIKPTTNIDPNRYQYPSFGPCYQEADGKKESDINNISIGDSLCSLNFFSDFDDSDSLYYNSENLCYE